MRRLFLGSLAIAAFVGGPTMAADMPVKAPVRALAPVVTIYNWSGFYIGAHAGYGWGDADYRFLTDGHYNDIPGETFSHRTRGTLAGGHVGYNWQSGHFLFGFEAAGTWSDVGNAVTSPLRLRPDDLFTTKVRWLVTATPRVGVTSNNWLFYAKGGVAFSEIFNRLQDNLDFVEVTNTRTGWTVGGGVEVGLAANWIFGVEANYYDFGTLNVNEEPRLRATGALTGFTRTNHDLQATMVSVLGRISYKFGATPDVARY